MNTQGQTSLLFEISQKNNWRVGIPSTCLTLPCLCACPKPGPEFPSSYVVVFFKFNELRWEVIVCFVNIGGIVDHHCDNFLFIIDHKTVNIGNRIFVEYCKILVECYKMCCNLLKVNVEESTITRKQKPSKIHLRCTHCCHG